MKIYLVKIHTLNLGHLNMCHRCHLHHLARFGQVQVLQGGTVLRLGLAQAHFPHRAQGRVRGLARRPEGRRGPGVVVLGRVRGVARELRDLVRVRVVERPADLRLRGGVNVLEANQRPAQRVRRRLELGLHAARVLGARVRDCECGSRTYAP